MIGITFISHQVGHHNVSYLFQYNIFMATAIAEKENNSDQPARLEDDIYNGGRGGRSLYPRS